MIELRDVTRIFQGRSGGKTYRVVAVDSVSFRVEEGETLCLIGTSGSGKTTCMKMINRLIEPTSGEIRVDGTEVRRFDVVRLRRRIGYVIQKGGLFPHMTVAQNVGLLPRLEGWPAARIERRVEELLERVNLPPAEFARRYPRELSGGQQQRVGVARALALDPPHILMDEPFGALDPITRNTLQEEFLRLQREVRKTIILVTHDLEEAFKMGDRIALMDAGRLVQVGTPEELLARPADDFVAAFLRRHLERPGDLPVREALDGSLAADSLSPEGAVASDLPLRAALEHMLSRGVSRLSVVEDGRVVGAVSRESLLARL